MKSRSLFKILREGERILTSGSIFLHSLVLGFESAGKKLDG